MEELSPGGLLGYLRCRASADATLPRPAGLRPDMDEKPKLIWTKPELRKLKLTPELLELLGPEAKRLMAEEMGRTNS